MRVSLYGQNLTFDFTCLEILEQILIMLFISYLETSILVLCIYNGSLYTSLHQNNSIDHLNIVNLKDLDEFYKWFVGFSDAEGMFNITQILNKGKVEGFESSREDLIFISLRDIKISFRKNKSFILLIPSFLLRKKEGIEILLVIKFLIY